MLIAPISRPGVVLSQPPISTAPSIGRLRSDFFRVHGEQVAIEHRARLHVRFGDGEGRNLHRKSARLPHAALHRLGALAQMRVARIDLAPRIDDGDHGPAGEILLPIAELLHARAMAEAAHGVGAEPAEAAEFFRLFFCFITIHDIGRFSLRTNAQANTPATIMHPVRHHSPAR